MSGRILRLWIIYLPGWGGLFLGYLIDKSCDSNLEITIQNNELLESLIEKGDSIISLRGLGW